MSNINLKRIKEIRQLQEQGYSDPIPLGSEGQYIDMSSKLDLEEELKLGGNHKVEIIEEEDLTQIIEYYLDDDGTGGSAVYVVKTTIQSSSLIKILVGQSVDQNQEIIQYNYLATDDNIPISIGVSQESITSELFKGQDSIHLKTIDFNQLETKTIITEEVVI